MRFSISPKRRIRRVTAVAMAGFVTAALAAVAPPQVAPAPPAQAAAVCDTAKGGKKFYPGDDSSRTYNKIFGGSRSIDHFLSDYVPQGLGVWQNWNGGSEDLFLIGMHHEDESKGDDASDAKEPRGLVYGISTTTGKFRGYMYLPKGAHSGGLKTYQSGKKQWLYVQQNPGRLSRYNLSTVRAAFRGKGTRTPTPTSIKVTKSISFFDIRGGKLFGGRFNPDARDSMYRWTIKANGSLSRDTSFKKQVPKKAQGLVVLSDAYVFSTSSGRNNRSNIYVTRKNYKADFEKTDYKCFAAPVLSQELVDYGKNVFLSFEGGADYFDGNFPWTTADNKIKHLHRASVSTLRGLPE